VAVRRREYGAAVARLAGRWAGGLATLVVIGVAAAPAAAQTLAPTSSPLEGSNFQGGDGNQVPAGTFDDWASLRPDQLVHKRDDNTRDVGFQSGAEYLPDEWALVTNDGPVSPPATNILDAWSSLEEVGGSTFLYLAFTRAASGGTTFLTFELNRDDRLWRNAAGSLIPCRLDGDLLITFEAKGGDPNIAVRVQRWVTAADGTDPVSGCARSGTLTPAAGLPAGAIQGAANNAAITNHLPGSHAAGASIGARLFGEMAVNAGAVFGQLLGSRCGAFTSVWMHSRSSDSPQAALQDFVAPEPIDLRRCSAAGTKWLDRNADGARQGSDHGLQGWRIYADLNGNGRYDQGEPFAISDEHGDYVIDDIHTTGSYTLREEPHDAPLTGPWTCSYPVPCSWTVDPEAEPFALDRDFGNWNPARVTLVKNLDPPGDPGRFDLSVGDLTLEGAGHEDEETFELEPGTYAVREAAAEGTDGGDYISTVVCTEHSPRRELSIEVRAGDRVRCTFVNARIGTPSITIVKEAPRESTLTGEPLVYRLRVINGGSVPFAADTVRVVDSQCGDITLVEQLDGDGAPDGTPASLDPGDEWKYRCQVETALPDDPDDCEPQTVENTAQVLVPDAGDRDSEIARLHCPPPRRRDVEIVKVGPATAVAGTPLTYRFYVRNSGEAPFAARDVLVSDPDCDAPPVIVARYAEAGDRTDESPTTLDAGDHWIYECTRTTDAPADCRPFLLPNTATVEAEPAFDDDRLQTPMTCPPVPPAPPPPAPPPPGPPDPPVPGASGDRPEVAVADVPDAGTAGRASLRRMPRCLRRGSRVTIRGARMAAVRVTLGGRRVGGLRIRALQRRAVIRLRRDFRPGRHRLTARVRFQRGAATPTLRLTRTVRICAPLRSQTQPRFTG
jgi:hypothetical protein